MVWERCVRSAPVKLISNIKHILALPQDVFRLAIVNRGWRQQAYPRVTMLSVVPPETERKHDVLDRTQSGPGTPADTLGFGIGSRKRDCRLRRAADYAFS